MSFAVIHMQKIKTGGIRGIQNHNERLKESKTNPDIDPTKTHLNKDLKGEDDRTYYNRVKDRIKELDLPKAVRKDAVTMCGFVCTSDKAFFDKLPQSEQDRFFKESHDFLKDRYGEKNVVASKVHYDEKTPHLHCYIVPVTEDGRLSAKNIFTRSELQKLQTEYHKHMNDKGFELDRGLSSDGKRKHLDTQEFKIETKKQEIEKLENKNIEKFKSIEYVAQTLSKSEEHIKGILNRLEGIQAKPQRFSRNLTISEEDYSILVSVARKGEGKLLENMQLKAHNSSLEEKLDKLNSDYNKTSKDNSKLFRENMDLKRDNIRLKKSFNRVEKAISNLEITDKVNHEIKVMVNREKSRGIER